MAIWFFPQWPQTSERQIFIHLGLWPSIHCDLPAMAMFTSLPEASMKITVHHVDSSILSPWITKWLTPNHLISNIIHLWSGMEKSWLIIWIHHDSPWITGQKNPIQPWITSKLMLITVCIPSLPVPSDPVVSELPISVFRVPDHVRLHDTQHDSALRLTSINH
jgi:hypothetical protein